MSFCASPRGKPCSQSRRWDRHGDVSDGDWQGNQEVCVPHQPRELLGSGGPRRHPEYCHWSVSESSHNTGADRNTAIVYVSSTLWTTKELFCTISVCSSVWLFNFFCFFYPLVKHKYLIICSPPPRHMNFDLLSYKSNECFVRNKVKVLIQWLIFI